MSYKLHVTSSELRVTGYELRTIGAFREELPIGGNHE